MRENNSDPQAIVVQSVVMSRTEEKTLCAPIMLCQQNVTADFS